MTITENPQPLSDSPSTRPLSIRPEDSKAKLKHRQRIIKVIAKRSFCTLATSSPAGRPHTAGVVYVYVDGSLWIHTLRGSRKARSIAANGFAAATIAFRRMPAGPPFTIHFQADAAVVAMDDPEARSRIDAGQLSKISGHGALDEPDGCFLQITPRGRIHSYGPGARVLDLITDPLHHGFASFPVHGPNHSA